MDSFNITPRCSHLLYLVSICLYQICFTQLGMTADSTPDAQFERVLKKKFSDLNETTRQLRVLVSYSNSNFFYAKGQAKGIEAELMQQYERYLNKGLYRGKPKVHIVFIVLPFKQLIPSLINGRGDIVAAGLTITPERRDLVAFSTPYISNVKEIVVTAQGITDLRHLDDLSGRTVHVVSGSSYVQSLERLNLWFEKMRQPPIHIVEVDETLESEDIMQMINAGIFKLAVVDHHIASLWSQVFKNIVLRQDLVVGSGGKIAWAVRPDNPKLLESLSDFIRDHRRGTLLGNIYFKRYFRNTKWIRNPVSAAELKRMESMDGLFKKYAHRYGFDWFKIAALAYQESRLNQNRRSKAGAVGVMQIKPSTAADANINITDIHLLENNIHAGVKYLAFLRDRYFTDPSIPVDDRVDFTFAAYNAGPARINALRRETQKIGLDPNKWFFNVEVVARRKIGAETVQYVSNVNKYYIAYKSMEDIRLKKERAVKKKQY